MPQFHSSVVVAVQRNPLIASATHAVLLTWTKGINSTFRCIHCATSQEPAIQTTSIAVPEKMVYAVTTGGLWVSISFLLSRIHTSAQIRDAITSRSPPSEGVSRPVVARFPPRTTNAAPTVDAPNASHPR